MLAKIPTSRHRAGARMTGAAKTINAAGARHPMAASPSNDAPPQRTKGLLKREARTARMVSTANAARSAKQIVFSMGAISKRFCSMKSGGSA
jgi:hypothetical protein